MQERDLQISEAALRLTLAVMALVFAAWLGQSQPKSSNAPHPGKVLEW
jgi:hypothetical protein